MLSKNVAEGESDLWWVQREMAKIKLVLNASKTECIDKSHKGSFTILGLYATRRVLTDIWIKRALNDMLVQELLPAWSVRWPRICGRRHPGNRTAIKPFV